MHPELPQLYALHLVDARLLSLDRTLRNLDNGERAKATLLAGRRELERREEALKRARVTLLEAESALKSNEAKQETLNKRLYGGSIHSTREVESTEHEIATLKAAAGDLETTILETMDTIESQEAAVADQKEAVAQREKELATTLAKFAQESTALRGQIAEATKERAAAAAAVPKDLMTKYDAARRRTKDTGMSVMDGVTCGACRMQVPGIAVNKLANTDEVVTCDNCGRILYRKA